MARTHVLIRLKSDIPLRRITPILADGSYLAELAGDGVTVTVRVIEYFADVRGQDVPEMFCLAGQPVRPREISHARTRRAILAAIRAGRTGYEALTREIGKYRTIADRNRHRARKSKSPSSIGHASAKDILTRIAPAIITRANQPA